jgi:two-component system OmpR family response regulator
MELATDVTGAGARILMVDDDPGIRDVVSDFLGRHGYKVETAADAAEMERALERGPVDLIVLDVMLPGEDGLAVCRRLTTTETAPPIIMLSAMGEDTDRIVGLELGADDYLAKLAGGNLLRAMRQAEAVAASMKDEPPAMATLDAAK